MGGRGGEGGEGEEVTMIPSSAQLPAARALILVKEHPVVERAYVKKSECPSCYGIRSRT